jgi:hypothetical protein
MEEGEEEQWDNNDIIPDGACFNDTAMGEAEEAVAVEDEPTDDLGPVIRDAQRECESEKKKMKFERMLEDHKKLLYPTCDAGQKKVGNHTRIVAMDGKEWCI